MAGVGYAASPRAHIATPEFPIRRDLSWLLPLAYPAADFYVGPGGDDTHPGTEAQPLATIQAAANKLQPGDTLLIRGGTYRETVTFPRSGTADGLSAGAIAYTQDYRLAAQLTRG